MAIQKNRNNLIIIFQGDIMKKIKKTLYLFIALLMCLEPIKLIAEANNSNQIVNTGGETVGDGVKVSKTISNYWRVL